MSKVIFINKKFVNKKVHKIYILFYIQIEYG
uniref:Uncharacterized protein n=1 Tax=viral metagenome TaxID=1070528 RepID=A0A6C0JE25_9ZZZZ